MSGVDVYCAGFVKDNIAEIAFSTKNPLSPSRRPFEPHNFKGEYPITYQTPAFDIAASGGKNRHWQHRFQDLLRGAKRYRTPRRLRAQETVMPSRYSGYSIRHALKRITGKEPEEFHY
jgi:hypothetical protein